jgi:general secretion pathway protein G
MKRMQRKASVIFFICVLLLAWIAFDRFYRFPNHTLHTNEATLKEDLFNMRQAIDQYTQDKGRAPQTLDDIVTAGYLKAIPEDPFTNRADTWQPLPLQQDILTPVEENMPGITDVTSGANLTSSDGTGYSNW